MILCRVAVLVADDKEWCNVRGGRAGSGWIDKYIVGDSNKSIGVCIDKYIVGAGSWIAATSYYLVIEQGGGAEGGIRALTCLSTLLLWSWCKLLNSNSHFAPTFPYQISVGESHNLWSSHLFSGNPLKFYICKKCPAATVWNVLSARALPKLTKLIAPRERMGWPWKAVSCQPNQSRQTCDFFSSHFFDYFAYLTILLI